MLESWFWDQSYSSLLFRCAAVNNKQSMTAQSHNLIQQDSFLDRARSYLSTVTGWRNCDNLKNHNSPPLSMDECATLSLHFCIDKCTPVIFQSSGTKKLMFQSCAEKFIFHFFWYLCYETLMTFEDLGNLYSFFFSISRVLDVVYISVSCICLGSVIGCVYQMIFQKQDA